MTAASQPTLGESTLQDIAPPPAPPPAGLETGTMVLAAVVAVLALLALHRLGRRYRRARRQLGRVRSRLARGEIDPRASVYEAAACLRRRHGCPRLEGLVPRAGDAARWHQFLAALDDARYAPAAPSRDRAERLLAETGRWLRRPLRPVRETSQWAPASN